MGIDHDQPSPNTWYIDLLDVAEEDGRLMFRDLWIDVMVPTDGRHYRMLDLDEFADAVEQRLLPLEVALDGLRRWQRFLDEFLHHERDPRATWTDFRPRCSTTWRLCPVRSQRPCASPDPGIGGRRRRPMHLPWLPTRGYRRAHGWGADGAGGL